jgi:hypothetical protein
MSNHHVFALFDGGQETFNNWRKVGPNDFLLNESEIVTTGSGDFAVLYYAAGTFGNFLLTLEFRISDPTKDNSGIFVRFRNPELPPTAELLAQDQRGDIYRNAAWIAAYSGFEIQIDEQAKGDKQKKERDGLDKHRTGAIYKIPTGQEGEPRLQDYHPGPPLRAKEWNDYRIEVVDQTYIVHLNGHRTTTFTNTDHSRGLPPHSNSGSGYIGLQSYRDSQVSFRNIQLSLL